MSSELELDLMRPRGRADASERELELAYEAKAAFASMFDGVAGEDLVLTDSTTHGIGLFMSGLGLVEGDEILTTDEEHIGLGAVMAAAAEGLRVTIKVAPFGDAAAIEGAVTDRTRAVVMSHLSYVSGKMSPRLDLPPAVPLLLDCAHTPGSVRFDPGESGVGAVAFPGQKWCLGPEGIGGLWVAPRWLEQIWPLGVSFRAMEQWHAPTDYEFRLGAARLDGGTLNKPVVAGLIESIRWLREEIGRERVIELTQSQADKAREALGRVEGVEVLSPPGTPGGLTGFRLADLDSREAAVEAYEAEAARLWEGGVLLRQIENPPGLRASVAWFNTDEEIDLLVESVARGIEARRAG
ncbi:MAG: hypothetical protein DCC49_13325 [Acidobacteria bacterium]|nr:MAG: hypothetical protein DCC49_13325 [Acidobacteriota bacterium]